MITVVMKQDKETKHTIRFTEEGDAPYVGTIYVPKATLVRELDWKPGQNLKLTLEVSNGSLHK